MLFLDPSCLRPYDDMTLATGPMGGSEATVVRVARGLGRMMVMQEGRTAPSVGPEPNATQHWPIDWGLIPAEGPVVVSRSVNHALHIRRLGARGRIFLWLHDLCDIDLALSLPQLAQEGIDLIAVSDWQRQQILDYSRACLDSASRVPAIHVVHNPIDDELAPDGETDPDKLVFNSSPHKGLAQVLQHFGALRARHPRLRLHVANPGYHPTPDLKLPGVYVNGSMSHPQLIAHTRDAHCLFYPNPAYPETFGLVYAEANALGVPALTHPIGAAAEVLADDRQLVDGLDSGAVIARFETWLDQGRPVVGRRDAFALGRIVGQWRDLLAMPSPSLN
ncbi:MAG: glycosyl transferase family 1 [Caulobacteraceae bacterium]|nr:glycosyl transferase family 1 [Caulobacteraceae bacterium]